ncbi:MAG: DUF5723 family protein [Bacteroidota bacterium]
MQFLRVFFFGLLALCLSFSSLAQHQLGLNIENYSGVNSVLSNPANNLTSQFSWDINLLSVGVFAENNYAYIGRTNLFHLLKNSNNVLFAPDLDSDYQAGPDDLIADYYNDDRTKFFSFSTQVMGPSFMIKLASGHSFGLFTNVRAVSNSRTIPPQLSYYQFDETPINESIEVPPVRVAGMAWSELGVNYAFSIPMEDGILGIGANAKWLNGYEGFYFANEQNTTIRRLQGDTIAADGPNFHFAFTDGNANDSGDFQLSRNGGGFGLDLGAVMTIEGYGAPYQWKFGFSLVDIGKISFSNNAQRHAFRSIETVAVPSNDYRDLPNDADSYIQRLSQDILGDSLASQISESFEVWLPTALNLNADYMIRPNVFVNASLVQRLPLGSNSLKRDNILALSPRFEKRWLGAALPLVMYNYSDFRMGLSLRLAFLTIGSDNLTSLFGRDDFTGTDFYFAIKLNPFKLNFGGGGRGSRGKGVKCYNF